MNNSHKIMRGSEIGADNYELRSSRYEIFKLSGKKILEIKMYRIWIHVDDVWQNQYNIVK